MDTSRAAESFRDLLLRHRGRTGLTQIELAGRMGAGRRTVQDWEAGINHPSAELLKALIQALLEADGLTAGREAAEAEEVWAAVLRDAPRMHTPFDELWLASLLRERAAPSPAPEAAHHAGTVAPVASSAETGEERRQDWGDAPDVLGFVGRVDEQALVRNWVLGQHCRVVGVLGIGGIGKTSIAAKLAKDVAPAFQRAYWRSLRNAPPVSEWLVDAIGFLSGQQVIAPKGEAAQLAALLELLRDRASLLVLDNFETLLEPRQREGGYRDGFAGYGALLRAIGEISHQSCLVVTSREAPPELAVLSGHPVRTLDLGGLGVPEARFLLADKQLSGNAEDWANLISRFGGNGLALKVVGETIRQVFGGDIGAFLDESGFGAVFGGIRRLLAEQIERSSVVEQEVLRVLAVEREPVTIAELIAELGPRAGRGAVLEAVEALRRRSLVERSQTTRAAAFTLQSVVLEYVTDRLVEEVCDEIARGQPLRLVEQPLIKAQAKDYVRQSQERLLGAPVLQQLKAEHRDLGAEQRLLALLDSWRDRAVEDQGYGPGNVVTLLRLQRGDLRGRDFAGLAIRQAYLAEVDAEDASLAGAHLSEAVLAEAFNFPICVALSGDGASLVTGTSAGEVWLWRVADRTPLMAIQMHSGPVYAVALSADGRLLAGGSEDGTVRLWETPGGHLLAALQGHTGAVWGVALSADGRLLARLAEAAERVEDYAGRSKSAATIRAYASGWRDFLSFCAHRDLSALPAAEQTVASYLADLADRGAKAATIARRLVVISQAHRGADLPSPTTSSLVRRVHAGVRRTIGTAQTGKAPAVVDDLKLMLGKLPGTRVGLRDRAVLLLGFSGAFRRSELVSLDVADLEFSRAGLIVTLRKSKTDQEGGGRRLGIPFGSSEATCPVRAVQSWLETGRITDGPIFRALDRFQRVQAGRLSDKAVARIVKRRAKAVGLDPARYAGHSLRAGLATSAAAAGASERVIMSQTGHRSADMVRKYIREGNLFTANPVTMVGL